jgi:hypothetical protein
MSKMAALVGVLLRKCWSFARATTKWMCRGVRVSAATTASELMREAPAVTIGGASALFGWAVGRDSQVIAMASPSGFWSLWSILATVFLLGGAFLWWRRVRLERGRRNAAEAVAAEDRRLLREVHQEVVKTGAITVSGAALTAASVGATGVGGPFRVIGPISFGGGIPGVYGVPDPTYPPVPPVYPQKRDGADDKGNDQ